MAGKDLFLREFTKELILTSLGKNHNYSIPKNFEDNEEVLLEKIRNVIKKHNLKSEISQINQKHFKN